MKINISKPMILAAALAAGVAFTACEDTLDADKYFDDRMNLESVFTDLNQANNWLSGSFTYLTYDLADVSVKGPGGRCFHVFADDIYWGDQNTWPDIIVDSSDPRDSYSSFKQGDYDEDYGSDFWINAYRGIYQASVFIHNIYRLEQISEAEKTDMRGQARFVRAYYYWLLLRRYGPVPIMPDEGVDYTKSYAELSFPRSSYEEVAEFISDEMIKAAQELANWSSFTGNTSAESIVRPTRGAALATRALALLYAASPLANGQLANGQHPAGVTAGWAETFTNRDGKKLLSTVYDEKKWARAAAALRDVMECPAGYQLYTTNVNTTNRMSDGYPLTVTPYDDGDFSTKDWPEGYRNIDPYLSYRDLFNGTVPLGNTEIVFSRGYNTIRPDDNRCYSLDAMSTYAMPATMGGFNCHGMTQKMVDTYYMADGTDVDGKFSEWSSYYSDPEDFNMRPRSDEWTSTKNPSRHPLVGNKVSRQYVGREPRFYACVGFNGSIWWNANPNTYAHNPQIFYYRGGAGSTSTGGGDNGVSNSSSYYLRTGIGFKKYTAPTDWKLTKDWREYEHITRKWEPAIRYADILLMYAEAINELSGSYTIATWDGSGSYNISRDINELKRGIRPVRCRAGVPDFSADVYGDQNRLRKRIKRERMIELVGEGKRYYDLRRWMDAPIEEAIPVYGCNINMPQSKAADFQRIIPVYSLPTVFSEKMYFWPIATQELKRNRNLVQNPGWRYND